MAMSDHIRQARELCGLTQRELAAKLGVTQQSVSDWEAGRSEPKLKRVVNLAATLRVTVDELCFGHDAGERERVRNSRDLRGLQMRLMALETDMRELMSDMQKLMIDMEEETGPGDDS